jgi:hypothetical protein
LIAGEMALVVGEAEETLAVNLLLQLQHQCEVVLLRLGRTVNPGTADMRRFIRVISWPSKKYSHSLIKQPATI